MRTKHSIYNSLTSILPQIIIGLIGIFKIKIFLDVLGSEVLGIYQLYNQIFVYLMLAEGGFTASVLYSLYEPLAKKDKDRVNQVLSTSKYIFTIVAITIIGIGIVLSFLLNIFIKETTLSYNFIQSAFLLFLIGSISNYFFISYHLVFNADQKLYKINLYIKVFTIIKALIEILLLSLGYGLYTILISSIVISYSLNIIIRHLAIKNYDFIKLNTKKDFKIWKQTKHLLVHKIGTIIAHNIDIVIISSFIGLKTVTIYSSYNYITSFIEKIINQVTTSILPSIGNIIVVDSKEKVRDIFYELNSMIFFIAMLVTIPLYFSLNIFIEHWVGIEILLPNSVMLLFVLVLFIKIIRSPLTSFTSASGKFKETKVATLISMSINLFLSLILVTKLGIAGVLLATLVSFTIANFIYRVRIVYKYVIKDNIVRYYINISKYIFSGVLIIAFNFMLMNFYINIASVSIITWFLSSLILFLIDLIILLAIFMMFKEFTLVNRLNFIYKKWRNK